jgi:NADP-dependent 3-hydroxy acid dehydrogenase YdfG
MDGPQEYVITGASSGVGRATAILLAQPGRRLWLLARRQRLLQAVASEVVQHGARAMPVPCDVADPAQVSEAFGRIGPTVNVLVNAAALPAGSVSASGPAEIVRVVAVNLVGTMLCARESARRMPAGGTIVNIGSLCVRVRDNGASLYVAAKLGVSGFTDAFRKEMAPHGIRVVLLNPGQIASGMVTETEEEKREAIAREVMLTPEEVAAAIRYCVELPERVVLTEMELRPRGQSFL